MKNIIANIVRGKSLTYFAAACVALAAAQTARAATDIYWKGGNGAEESPKNVYSKSCWTASSSYSGNDISLSPSVNHDLHFGFAADAEDTTAWLTSDGTTDSTVIANLFRTHSGHFIFTSGSFKVGYNFSIGYESGDNSTVTKNSGDWTIGGSMFVGQNGTGTLTINGGTLNVGDVNVGASGTGALTINGGTFNVRDVNVGDSGTGTLTINGGTLVVASDQRIGLGINGGSSGTLNLNGGVIKTRRIAKNSGSNTLNLNGGTLQANANNTTDFIASGVTVNVGAGGGVIDNGGYSITIPANLGGTGGLTLKGGGKTMLGSGNGSGANYSGQTAVVPGTTLLVYLNGVKDTILDKGLVVAGIPNVGDEIFVLTRGESDKYYISEDQLAKVTCPLAPTTTFARGEGNTNIVVATVGSELDNYWTGAANDNDLSNNANWKYGVPTGNANIFVTNAVTLTKGASFAPTSITFLAGSAPVTIDGGDFTGIVAITNLSSASHTINAKVYFEGDIQVKQAAMAETGDLKKTHVTFAGGAYAAPGCSLESGDFAAVYSRCIFGKYYLAPTSSSRWTAVYENNSRRVCLADNSSLYIPYAGELTELYVSKGAQVDVGDMNTTGRLLYQNYGEMIVSNLTVTGSANVHATYNQGTATPGVFKFNSLTNGITGGSSGNSIYLCDYFGKAKHVFYIGSGGLNYSSSSTMTVFYLGRDEDGNYETIRPWYSDFTIGERPGEGNVGLRLRRDVEFCTDDEGGTGRTITMDAITCAQNTPTITISGSGTLKVNKAALNTVQPPITLKDTATLAYATDTATLGTGTITLGEGTTFALTAASNEFTPLANAVTLPTEGAAHIRIDGARLRAGDYTILSNVTAGATANVNLDMRGTALAGRKRASLAVNGGNLVLTIEPSALIILVR